MRREREGVAASRQSSRDITEKKTEGVPFHRNLERLCSYLCLDFKHC